MRSSTASESGAGGGASQPRAGSGGSKPSASPNDPNDSSAGGSDPSAPSDPSTPSDPSANAGGAGGSDDDGAAGSSDPSKERCSSPGATRCAMHGMIGIERCAQDGWELARACASSETCTFENAVAECRPLEAACQGARVSHVCDAQGKLLECNPDGTAEDVERCTSLALCQAGAAVGRCAMCMPGTFRCTGAALEKCQPDGQAFGPHMTCATAELCKRDAGRCTAATCEAGDHMCDGNTLKTCNSSQTGWTNVRTCPAGLCDAQAETCRVCNPGQTMCQGGDTMATCDSRGQTYTPQRCSEKTPYCLAPGKCVECKSDADCEAGPCETRSCNVSTGACSAAKAAPAGTQCTAASPDQALPAECSPNKECAPVIALRMEARSAGDGTPIPAAWVSANPDGFIKAAGMNGPTPGPWEPFLMIRESPGSNRVALYSLFNKGYVTPVNPPSGGVPEGKPWPERKWLGSKAASRATFEFSSTALGTSTTIRSVSENMFWSAEDWTTPPSDYVVRVRTPSSDVGPWERFTIMKGR
ncbi:MAG TPA: hypothetical protein VJR89_00415 [Polyangiales bacterium]|nr:hypothetical protein [Polyangiales bacterium]